jgi:hypothetical protein
VASKLSISRAWDDTREVLRRDGKLITSVALALIVLPVAIGLLVAPPKALSGVEPAKWAGFVSLIVSLIGIAGQIAIIRLALGPAISVKEAIQHGFKRLVPAFAALFLFGLAAAIVAIPLMLVIAGPDALKSAVAEQPTPALGRALLIIGLLLLAAAVRFQLIMPVASAETGNPFQILRRSWELSKGQFLRLLGFLLLSLILALVLVLFLGQVGGALIAKTLFGTIAPFSLAALITGLLSGAAQAAFAMIVSVMMGRIYVQLAGGGAEASVPSSGI